MKKQGEQKTKGRSAAGDSAPATPATPEKAVNQLDKQKINSLKDKAAAKTKKGRH